MVRHLCALLLLATGFIYGSAAVDATATGDRSTASTTITTSAFSTTQSNELLLAFVATDALSGANTTVQGVSGAGLTWVLVVRSNGQKGTSEIWRAFAPSPLNGISVTATLSRSVASSLTVMSFSGVDPSGTNGSGAIGATHSSGAASGAPASTLTTTRNNSLVVGVGNDWDNAVARTPGAAQALVHQYLASIGDTYWVQMQSSSAQLSGSSVTINDTAPTADRYNLSICEILSAVSGAPTWSITGTLSPAAAGVSATVMLSGGAATQVTADSSGNYVFAGLADNSYTVTPNKAGFTFTPSNQPVTVNGANQPGINFTGQSIPTWSISGTISPAPGGSGVTVALSGTSTAMATTDANGNYSFSGLANGSYTLTPSKSGFTFSPANQPAAIAGANVPGINFGDQASGIQLLQKSVNGNEATGNNISATFPSPNSLGNFLIVTGTAARPHSTLTISDTAGNTYLPANGPVVDTAQDVTAYIWYVPSCKAGANTITLTPSTPGALEIHISEFTGISSSSPVDQISSATGTGTSATSGAKITTVNGELVFGYTFLFNTASAGAGFNGMSLVNGDLDEYQVQSTAGSVATTFSQTNGTWFALMATFFPSGALPPPTTWSISGTISPTVGGAGATVTLSGNANASVIADSSGNYTFANLTNGTYTVTPSNSGFTFTPVSRPVTIAGANQTGINFAVQPPPTWSISGTITPTTGGAGATVTLSGNANASVIADSSGNYTFTNLTNGTYTVTPSNSGFTFTPVSKSVTITGANQTGINFAVQPSSNWSISGTITPTGGGAGATVTLSGSANASVTTDGSGNYSFANLANGTYIVTPSNPGFTFTPVNKSLTVAGVSQPGINFSAQSSGNTWNISGTISPASGGSGATVALSGAATQSTSADANGNYTFSLLANGSYTVTPTKNGYTFSPASQPAIVSGANFTGVNFIAVAPSNSITLDANVSKDGSTKSTTIASPSFSTSAANELLLAFIATDYISGANTTVKSLSGAGLTWTLVVRSNGQSGTAEIWKAFTAVPLTTTTVTATLSQSVASSLTVMSFSGVDPSGTNGSGAIGATASTNASSGAPAATLVTTRNSSLVLGVGNDFDNAVARSIGASQTLVHQFLSPAGDTYWVQKQTSATPSSGSSVTINDTAPTKDRYNLSIVEILTGSGGVDNSPPTVSLTAPAQGATVAGLTTVSATASDDTSVAGVQFLLDGAAFGAEVTTPPYSIAWDTTTAAGGAHTLAARARDGVGLTTTSNPVNVTVDNSGNATIIGSWSSVVPLPAVAVNLVLLKNNKVLFYQDGSTPTVWDYTNNVFTNIPAPANLFCSGHALLPDGRVLVVGGYGESGTSIGIADAEIFDPSNNTWTTVPKMKYKRWYPTATTLPDGRILVTAGWQTSAHTNAGISEVYDPVANNWTELTNANNPFETYPFMYVMSDGRIIHIGGSEYATDTDILDLNTTSWSVIDSNIVDGGSATMYLPGKFMKAGSAADSQNVGPSSNTTFVLDTTQPSPSWQQTPSMANLRSFFNLTMLPDGSVLATGGETDKDGGKIANAVYAAELWSPQTQTWSIMASMHTPREYHGTALLLPDGRVLESGMGADFGNVPDEKSAEFFSPPYLFKGPRPTITQAPAQIPYGSNVLVGTPDGATIASVSLIRTGAVTHFFDQNSRYVPLSFQQTTGGLTVVAPANANLAPPGYYMLFIVNSAGVPSVAPFVQLP